ncbi:DNA polymerase III subunit delta [Antarcticirhabdus aurantiaca]|uniref:DNA polymerase III subunit delta n=1 Tax=Antarcticirhabdus aurantiaca TaxID=2606717 RepID=A0ACD4NPK5_9HYPH|nr:DNA polymerase III subunit delta [Antarcticirhabdus aurantiaca]WAJ28636.1 DNA polymerase III subunit delta [Jeongeuplla avenae]
MAERKAGEVDAFLSRPDTSFPILLIYGPDTGLVAERAKKAAALSGVDLSDPFASVLLEAAEVEREPGRLFDEARTVSLFGGRRLVRVKGATGSAKALAEAVAALAAEPPRDATIVIEAGDLKKSAPLRTAAEKGRGAMALPCYADEGRSLDGLIAEAMRSAGLVLEPQARDELKSRLGADRLASRGEIAKLALYAHGQPTVSAEDVAAIVGDVSADTLDEAIDAAASGEVKKLPHLIERLTSAGTPVFQLQQGLLRHFQQLQAMRAEMERSNDASPARVIEKRRPHFRRKAAFEAALSAWTTESLAEALSRIEADILLSRRESALALTLAHRLLLTIAVDAAKARNRRR